MFSKLFFILFIFLTNCVTSNKPKVPPVFTQTLPTHEVLVAAIDFGGDTLLKARKHLYKTHTWPKARDILREMILKKSSSQTPTQFINTMVLYEVSQDQNSKEVVSYLLSSERKLYIQWGLRLCGALPSVENARVLEARLSQALEQNDLDTYLYPELALAISNNKLVGLYTILRQGLMTTHQPSFARSMALIAPSKASKDFMEYLLLAPVEQLRQLNVEAVNVITCSEILRHFMSYAPDVYAPEFTQLYYFAVSRNQVLSELAQKVIESLVPVYGNHMAQVLVNMPSWVQIAHIENIRRGYTPVWSVFLQKVKNMTISKDIIDEIDQFPR